MLSPRRRYFVTHIFVSEEVEMLKGGEEEVSKVLVHVDL